MTKVTRNFIVNGLSSILSQFVTFLTMTYYAKVIGQSYFGSFTLAQQIVLYFSMFIMFGMQTLGIRMVAESGEKLNDTINEILSFRLINAIVSFIILIILYAAINKGYYFNNFLFIFSFSLFPLALNTDWLFNGLQEMQHNAVYNILKNIVPSIIIIIFIRNTGNLYMIPMALVIGNVLGIIYQISIIKIKYKFRIRFKIRKSIILKYAKLGMPFLISSLLAMVNGNIDKIIMGFSRTEAELGVYQAAYVFINFLINVEALIFTPFFPMYINYFSNKDIKAIKNLGRNVAKIVWIAIIPITVEIMILSKDIIQLFYGKKYINAYISLRILTIYILILYIREIYGYQLNAWKGEKFYLKAVSISAALNALLCIIFIPYFGYVAAAIITLVTEVVNLFVMKYYSDKIVKINIFQDTIRLIFPCIFLVLITLILYYYHVEIIINALISVMLYFIVLILFKVLTLNEIKLVFRKEAK
ncbi:flippase [Clostridium sp. 19966]|uniref:flippase n=1 Tax=Clostridium sp. 19966 TaxID=2768166 RepID=UPI0028DDA6A1|nr:flippase [Clostridium sp. 19966]MDT8716511.1 flippase [Clostridium sp. 19966]